MGYVLIMPTFKSVGQSNDAIAIKQKGRILIEFSPNNGGNQPGGGIGMKRSGLH